MLSRSLDFRLDGEVAMRSAARDVSSVSRKIRYSGSYSVKMIFKLAAMIKV